MLVLVNGSPTKGFEVEMGLQKGNPLSPFLFVIVAEGMTGFVRKASELGEFKGFSFHDSCSVDLLQFVDKTFIIGNGNWKNFWDSKVILRGFDTVFGLRVNFHKSRVIGMNLNSNFLVATTNFLLCMVEEKCFYFLGIPIGSNPRRVITWKLLMGKVRARISCWNGILLSIGGRIMLIKFVLRSLSIFFITFYKALVTVWKEIESIKNKFLWGGLEVEEDLGHLFFKCRVSDVIWNKVVDWIQIDWVNKALLWKSFSSWVSIEKFKMLKKGDEGIVWMAVVWSLWKIRNDILFNDAHSIVSNMLWDIKLTNLKWSLKGDNSHSNCNIFEFC
ncbi:hypothetical protein KIW84_076276 [Lathyrus oleraceus]|uniref:Reverse transcriptase domain-containing protein n=1 Tax=Pisum sativum TaxID=3888 RepID=A0A9D4VXM7_PEA|nr:hypothetical protein KIW84_076276 [Pisum sativum]